MKQDSCNNQNAPDHKRLSANGFQPENIEKQHKQEAESGQQIPMKSRLKGCTVL
jgi:hypothetical protein